jgi:hypothetical protein
MQLGKVLSFCNSTSITKKSIIKTKQNQTLWTIKKRKETSAPQKNNKQKNRSSKISKLKKSLKNQNNVLK